MESIVFREQLLKEVEALAAPEEEIRLRRVQKNNGVVLEGLTLAPAGTNVCPTLYIRELETLTDKGLTVPQIAKQLVEVCRDRSRQDDSLAEVLQDYGKAHSRICYRLVNCARNKAFLEEMPWRPCLDLAIMYYYQADLGGDVTGSITIRNEEMERWGVTEEKLYEDARRNTPVIEPAEVGALCELWNAADLHIFTNQRKVNGAAVMLYDGIFSSLADECGSDLLILPSSIHEVLAIPESANVEVAYLRSMVREINEAVVSVEERLSDNVYRFVRKRDRIVEA